jgi:hypothetical protein
MENNLILETSRIKEIMGISLSKDIISEGPKNWLEVLINAVKGDSRYVQRFFNEGSAFRNFDELRVFLKSGNGTQFLTKMDDLVRDLRSKGKNTKADMVEGLKNQLLAEKAKPIFSVEWNVVKSDIKINNLFTKNPNAEQSIKNWLQTQVAAGQSVNSIGMSKIENMIKKIPGGAKNRFEVVDFANKYISSGGAKIALGVVIGGAVLGFWTLTDVLKWLKDIVYKPETTPEIPEPPTPDNNLPLETW